MTIEIWLAFVIASIVLLVIPGPTILAVVSFSLSGGKGVILPAVAGVALGDATAIGLSMVGLGTVLAQSSFWFQMVKWAGGLYLLYLGVGMIIAAFKSEPVFSAANRAPGKKVFTSTYLATVLNPKSIIFFIAFLPQFIDPVLQTSLQLWILGVTFVVLATINAALYAYFADKARGLMSSGKAQHGFMISGGALLSAAGAWALADDGL